MLALLIFGTASLMFAAPVPIVVAQSVSAWNPNVSCSALVTTFQNVTGSSGAISTPWQTSSTTGGVPNKRALSPPCTITNTKGQVVSTLVQINGIYLPHLTYGDCSTTYNSVNGGGPYPDRNGDGKADTFCDDYGDIHSIGGGSTSIHIEFDQDWMAKGYCGPGHSPCDNDTITQYFSTGSISLDVQGFVYWDIGHWELHPFTAWKLSSSPQPFTTSFTYSPSNPSSGVSITFTATASSGTPPYTFNWNFGDGGSATGTQATHVYTTSGSFTVTLIANDSRGQTATASNTITINKRTTSTTIVCSPSSVQIGQSSTCTASVKDTSPGTPSTPAGTVSFTTKGGRGSFSGSPCSLLAVNSTNASCNVSYTPSGTKARTDTITGTYSPGVPDTLHNGSSGTFSLVVTKGGLHSTSTIISCTPSTVVIDQTASCNATVTDTSSSSATAPTGTVAFTPGGTCNLSSPSGASASCSVTVTPTSSGTLSISASYSGDSTHTASSGSSSLTVNKRTTSTTIVCSPASVQIGQSSTCTASVKDTSPGTPSTPAGTVSFTNGGGSFTGTPCSLGAVNSTTANCNVSYTPSGTSARTETITGTYTPAQSDTFHDGSLGTFPLSVIVAGLHSTSTSVSCTPSNVDVNQATSCTATIRDALTSGATAPTGTVTFTPGGTCTLGNPSGSSASCSVSVTPTAAGPMSVSARYNGDSTHATSSGSTTINVNKRATSMAVNCSPNPVTTNSSTNCTATLNDTDAGAAITPTGSVSFASNSTGTFNLLTCSLTATATAGAASCSVSYTPSIAGHHKMTGSYAGDSSHTGSSGSATVTVTTQPRQEPYALVISEQGSVFKYQNGTFTLIGQPVTTPLRQVAWKPDGSYALIVGDSGVLLKYDGSQLTTIPTGITANLYALAWRPDGSYALISGSGGPLIKYDGNTLTQLQNSFTNSIRSISWNPSGTQALMVGSLGGIFLYQPSTGQVTKISSGTTQYLYSSSWNPNGLYALVAGINNTVLRYDGSGVQAFDTTGLYSSSVIIHAISWDPSGTQALLKDQTRIAHLFELTDLV
ncbi:PKD domain-containing protein [Candidatus Bathyarchaeota archaeon]|nr:MAG: PKD domain-containing protein [Candidatus Bathyarchaeota archaeon]